jgi:hypothetical protein
VGYSCFDCSEIERRRTRKMASQAPITATGGGNTYTLPTTLHDTQSSSSRRQWKSRLNFLNSSSSSSPSKAPVEHHHDGTEADLGRRTTGKSEREKRWWKIRLFRGMINDVKRRAPFYKSDWVDAWDYRVVPATVYMYFAK